MSVKDEMTSLDVMKQALEALNKYAYYDTNKGYRCVACNTLHINSHLEWCPMLIAERNLRTAIEEMEKAEPVAWGYTGKLTNGEVLTHQPPDRIIEPEQFYIRPLYLHPAPIPEGWQLVPKDYTYAMHQAWLEGNSFDERYKAMLAAAPKLEDAK